MSGVVVKIIGFVAPVVGLIATSLSNWASDKRSEEQMRKIADEVYTQKSKDKEES